MTQVRIVPWYFKGCMSKRYTNEKRIAHGHQLAKSPKDSATDLILWIVMGVCSSVAMD